MIPEPSRPEPHSAADTILVVDDEATIRTCVSGVLASLGFKVIEASDGEEAVAQYQAQADAIALVFMDITMPRMNGITATQKIRAINPKAKVILSSGGFADCDLKDAQADAFLPKPYVCRTLCEVIQKVLGIEPSQSRPSGK